MSREKELLEWQEQLKEYEEKLKESEKDLRYKEEVLNQQYINSNYPSYHKQNLVEWELDFREELQEIARSLRCDVLEIDEDGNEKWVRNPDKDRVFLNDLGVNDVLRKIILLVNKNKVLSNYTIEEIRERVRQIGHEIRCLIYNNYEAYGIDNEYKMNNFPSIVMDCLDIIESAFRRAIKGETHKRLNEHRIVTQTDRIDDYQTPLQPIKKSKWYKPSTW